MRLLQILKVMVLILILMGVIAVMRGINAGSVQGFFDALGIEPGAAGSPGLQPSQRPLAAGESRVNICPNRIHAIIWADGRKVEEIRQGLKLRWTAFDPEPREIGYMDVEKWLSLHCQIVGRPADASSREQADFRDFVIIQYIDKKETKVQSAGGDLIRFDEDSARVYHSEDFLQALEELEQTAGFQRSGG
jgi:hypothetical protein